MMDKLSKKKIDSLLGNSGNTVVVLDEVDSTNTEIRRLADKGAKSGTVVIANSQTSGRGRLGRSFFSPADSGIYMSVLHNPCFDAEKAVLVTTAVSVVVCRAIEKITKKQPLIKWVNDLYLNDKKICGILTEAVRDANIGAIEYIIIGIGINCKQSDFPDDIKDIAGHIADDSRKSFRNELVVEIIKGLNNIDEIIQDGSFIAEYKRRSFILGKMIKIMGENELKARAIDVNEIGGLVVELEDGEVKTLSSGEISIRLDN